LKDASKQSTSESQTDFCSFERRGLGRLSGKTTERIKNSDEDIKTGRRKDREEERSKKKLQNILMTASLPGQILERAQQN